MIALFGCKVRMEFGNTGLGEGCTGRDLLGSQRSVRTIFQTIAKAL